MAETRLLTDHQEIKDWAASRSGAPAIIDAAELAGNDIPVLLIEFGQHAYEDDDDQGADRPADFGRPRLAEWDEWFSIFDQEQLGLVVGEDVPGQRDEFHEIIRR